MSERAKPGKRARRAKPASEPATPRRSGSKRAHAAPVQRQLLLPSEGERSVPLRAAATSKRKRGPGSRRGAEADALEAATEASAERAQKLALELELTGLAEARGDRVVLAADGGEHAGGVEGANASVHTDSVLAAADGGEHAGGVEDVSAAVQAVLAVAAAEGGEHAGTGDCVSASAPEDPAVAAADGGAVACVSATSTTNLDPSHVENLLTALEARGARAYDCPSCDCVRALLQRAQHATPRAAALLVDRAAVHVQRLADRYDRARASLEARITEAELLFGPLPAERAACARGDLLSARRSLRLRACSPTSLAFAKPEPPPDRAQPLDDYQAASNEWVAVSALARAVDVVPEQAGPYNPLRIASDLLERIRAVSPTYLNAQLTRLEELASMLALPELPEPAPKLPARKQRGG